MENKISFEINSVRRVDNLNYYTYTWDCYDNPVLQINIVMTREVYDNLVYGNFDNKRNLLINIEPIETKESDK